MAERAYGIDDEYGRMRRLPRNGRKRESEEAQKGRIMNYYLAIDIGASSGRHLLGWRENGKIFTQEVYRFPNGVTESGGHLVWDIGLLEQHVKAGIEAALKLQPHIQSLSIDTWGVDYVLMRGDQAVPPCHAYRDSRTQASIGEAHSLMPFEDLYSRTGIQFQPFNTLYQLMADRQAGRLEGVTDFLFMPEYLLYRLSGVKAHEYTNATTSGLVNALSGQYDLELVHALGLPGHLFRPLQQPGITIGTYHGIRVALCATHDTASAVEGIPMDGNELYLSSGTWSLLGAKIPSPMTDEASRRANFSNEGGVGYIRYQKNITGMWLVNRLRSELCPEQQWEKITSGAERSGFDETVDVNDPVFLSPESMCAAFDSRLRQAPKNPEDYFRCAYRSLVASYQQTILELEKNTKQSCRKLYIVGGGAKNHFLNRLIGESTGREVIALPIEATALGNLKVQMDIDEK